MKKILYKIFNWIKSKYYSIVIAISIALYNTEINILKADPNNLKEGDKKTTRKLHHNPLLEKFYAGKSDEKYTRDYYEILKKADKFMRNATAHEMAVAADKHGMNYANEAMNKVMDNLKKGNKEIAEIKNISDENNNEVCEHLGFFDKKHKYFGKTIAEVAAIEIEERRTKDDDYEIVYMFKNSPIETGIGKIFDILEKTTKEDATYEYEVVDVYKKSKQFEFPIKVYRDNKDILNKIEQLAEFLNVKKIGLEYRQLEFFIPLKFKTNEIETDSYIFKEIMDMKEVFIRDEYGTLRGFAIKEFTKRIIFNDTHEVLKFQAIEMENMSL